MRTRRSILKEDGETNEESDGKTKSGNVVPQDSAENSVEGTREASIPVEVSSTNSVSIEDAALSEGKSDTNTEVKTVSVDVVPRQSNEKSDKDSIHNQPSSKAQEVSVEGSATNSELTGDNTGPEGMPEKFSHFDVIPEESAEGSSQNNGSSSNQLDSNSIIGTDTGPVVDRATESKSPVQGEVISKEAEVGSVVTSAREATSDSAESKAAPKEENVSGSPASNDALKVEQTLDESVAHPAVSSGIPVIAGADASSADFTSSVPSAVTKNECDAMSKETDVSSVVTSAINASSESEAAPKEENPFVIGSPANNDAESIALPAVSSGVPIIAGADASSADFTSSVPSAVTKNECDAKPKETDVGSVVTSTINASSDSAESEAALKEENPFVIGSPANNDALKVEQTSDESIARPAVSSGVPIIAGADASSADFTSSVPSAVTKNECDAMPKKTDVGSVVTSAINASCDPAESEAAPKEENRLGSPANNDALKMEQTLNESIARRAVSSGVPVIAGTGASLADSNSSVSNSVTRKESTPVQRNPSVVQTTKGTLNTAGTSNNPSTNDTRKTENVFGKQVSYIGILKNMQMYKIIAQKFCKKRKIAFPSRKIFKRLIVMLWRANQLTQNNLEKRLIAESLRNPRPFTANANGCKAAVTIQERKETEQSQAKRSGPSQADRKAFKKIAEKYCEAKKQPLPPGNCFEKILSDLSAANNLNERGLNSALDDFASSQEKWKQWIQTKRKQGEQNRGKGKMLPAVMKDITEMSLDERSAFNGTVRNLMEEMRPVVIKHCHAIEAPFPTINYFYICRDLFHAGILNEENLKIAIEMDFEDVCNRPLNIEQTTFILRRYCQERGIACTKYTRLRKQILPITPKKLLCVKHYFSLMYRDKQTNLFLKKYYDPSAVKKSNESNSAGKSEVPNAGKTQPNSENKGGLNTPKILAAKSIGQENKPSGEAAGPKPVGSHEKHSCKKKRKRIRRIQSNAQPNKVDGSSQNSSYIKPWGASSSGTFLNPRSSNHSEHILNDNSQGYREESITDLLLQTKLLINQKERLLGGLENRGRDQSHHPWKRSRSPYSTFRSERFKEQPGKATPPPTQHIADFTSCTNIGGAHGPSTSWQEPCDYANAYTATQRDQYSQEYDVGEHSRNPGGPLQTYGYRKKSAAKNNKREWFEHDPLLESRLPTPRISTTKFCDGKERSLQNKDDDDWRFQRGPRIKKSRFVGDMQCQSGQSADFHRMDDDFRSRFSDDWQQSRSFDEQRQTGSSADFHRLDDDFQYRSDVDRQPSRSVDEQHQNVRSADFYRMDDDRQPSRPIDELRRSGESADFHRTDDVFQSQFIDHEQPSSSVDENYLENDFRWRYATDKPKTNQSDVRSVVSELLSQLANTQPRSLSAHLENEMNEFDRWMAQNSMMSTEPAATSSQVPRGRSSPPAVAHSKLATLEDPPSVRPGKTCRVALVPNDYPENEVTDEEATLIRNTLLERIGAQRGVGPRFAGTYEEQGAVVFECEDQLTVSWIWANAPTIKLGRNTRLRPTCWEKSQVEILIEIPKMLQNLTPHAICERLESQNPSLSTKDWKLKLTDLTDLKPVFAFYIDEKSLKILKSLELRPYLGFSRVKVNVIQEQFRN